MSIAEWKPDFTLRCQHQTGGTEDGPRKLHRIREVREQQGMSLRSAARRLQMEMSEVRAMEDPASDMLLSMLHEWQKALDVPVGSLLVDQDEPLSEPILHRARMVRLMKTAGALQERATDKSVQRLAAMLIEQLIEMMPELKDVSPWHAVGQRRSLDECGRIAEEPISEDWLFNPGG